MKRLTEQERFEAAVAAAQKNPCAWQWADCRAKRAYGDWLCPAHRAERQRMYAAMGAEAAGVPR